MTLILRISAVAVLIGLGACEQVDRYPISEQTCSANDPVRSLDMNDCRIPGL
jgi:hypothetical protein